MGKVADLVGIRFGSLTVTAFSRLNKHRKAVWACACDCGASTIAVTAELKRGHKKSCGCLKGEAAARLKFRHGKTQTAEHRAWRGMLDRTTNPNHKDYSDYGERGIRVEYASFEQFLSDVGERPTPDHSLDRIDNDGNYRPGNVRWATRSEQGNNRRSNRLVTVDGVTKTIAQWAERTGLAATTIRARLNYGWPAQEALTKPETFNNTHALRVSRGMSR